MTWARSGKLTPRPTHPQLNRARHIFFVWRYSVFKNRVCCNIKIQRILPLNESLNAGAARCWPFHGSQHLLSSAPRPLTPAPVTQNQVCLTWRRWQERILNRWQLSLRISWLPGLVTTSFRGWLSGTSLCKTGCVSWLLIPPRARAACTEVPVGARAAVVVIVWDFSPRDGGS